MNKAGVKAEEMIAPPEAVKPPPIPVRIHAFLFLKIIRKLKN